MSVTTPSLSCVSATGKAHTSGSILANSLAGIDGAVPIGQRNSLAYHNLATNFHRLGVQDKVIQAILRHLNVSVTQA